MTKDKGQSRTFVWFGATPLTDPRSLVGSALFHVCLLLVVSLKILNAVLPQTAPASTKALYAEVDPVDNRAERFPRSPGEGGGGPGDIGGTSTLPFIPVDNGKDSQNATRDPAAETLLAEILPSSLPRPHETPQRLARAPDCRSGHHPRIGIRRRGRRGRRFRRWRRPEHRTGNRVLWCARPCSLLHVRDRLLGKHGHP